MTWVSNVGMICTQFSIMVSVSKILSHYQISFLVWGLKIGHKVLKGFKLRGLGQGELSMWTQPTFPSFTCKKVFSMEYIFCIEVLLELRKPLFISPDS